jgi:hypothetical protein
LFAWFLNTGHKLAGIVIFATQLIVHWEDILDRFSSVFGLRKIYERRHEMGLQQDFKLAVTFIPMMEKIISDAKAAEQTPATTQLIADVQALIVAIKAVS